METRLPTRGLGRTLVRIRPEVGLDYNGPKELDGTDSIALVRELRVELRDRVRDEDLWYSIVNDDRYQDPSVGIHT